MKQASILCLVMCCVSCARTYQVSLVATQQAEANTRILESVFERAGLSYEIHLQDNFEKALEDTDRGMYDFEGARTPGIEAFVQNLVRVEPPIRSVKFSILALEARDDISEATYRDLRLGGELGVKIVENRYRDADLRLFPSLEKLVEGVQSGLVDVIIVGNANLLQIDDGVQLVEVSTFANEVFIYTHRRLVERSPDVIERLSAAIVEVVGQQ